MVTAVDTNVLLDILIPGAAHGDSAEERLSDALRAGATLICEAVYVDLAAHFPGREELDGFLEDTGIRMQATGAEALYLAGQKWRSYVDRRPRSLRCPACGASQDVRCCACAALLAPRQHVVADFLIGSHAVMHAERLLTRDRGHYRTYFPDLQLA
jgi:hypothetical protein